MPENVDNFIRVSRTPVWVGNFPLKSFVVGDLAGVGPENNEFVFVLNGDWGPININSENKGAIKPGEFTLIKGDKTFLQWVQGGERTKVLVIKEPSVNDKRSVSKIDLGQATPNFTKDNFVDLARNNSGLIASPNQTNESLRTKTIQISYFQNDFPFKPYFAQQDKEVLILAVGGNATFVTDGKKLDLSAGE